MEFFWYIIFNLKKNLLESNEKTNNLLNERICVSGMWLTFVLILIILITAIVAFLLIDRFRKYQIAKRLKQNQCLHDEQDNKSSYLNF